jgi:hypothetical protein
MQKHHHDCSNTEICRASLDVQCSEDNPQPKSHNHTAVWCKKQWSTTDIVHHERRCHGFYPIGSRIDAVDLVLEEWIRVTKKVENFASRNASLIKNSKFDESEKDSLEIISNQSIATQLREEATADTD